MERLATYIARTNEWNDECQERQSLSSPSLFQFQWREASYGSNDGDVVRVYTVCLVASTSVNNWLRTPFIKRHDANRIFVEVRFTMRKCTKYPEPNRLQQCKESFRILHHQSDRDYRPEELPPWDETAYKLVDVIPGGSGLSL